MEVALYVRVSTTRQQQHQTIEQQLQPPARLRGDATPIGMSPTSTSIAMTATAVPRSSVPVSTDSEIGRDGRL